MTVKKINYVYTGTETPNHLKQFLDENGLKIKNLSDSQVIEELTTIIDKCSSGGSQTVCIGYDSIDGQVLGYRVRTKPLPPE
jgi:hypothetical protein